MPLIDKIQDKTAIIGVVGLGYVGLPLAIAFAEAGFTVKGFDTNIAKVRELHNGRTDIIGISTSKLVQLMSNSQLSINHGLPSKWLVDAVIICVPTPITIDKKPDLNCITDAVKQIKGKLAIRDSIVILESSTYPSTTRDVVLPILDGAAKYVAYSPERVDPGSREFNIRNTPKLVGGINKKSAMLATKLYQHIVDWVVPVSSPEVAETVKLYENVFRNVNIALANEMALICEKIGVSVWEVIDAAATKPFGFMPFYPGVGVGGHCVATDDYYLMDKARACGYQPELDTVALSINAKMPQRVAHWLVDILVRWQQSIKEAKILVLGVAFKRDVGDIRESPSLELINILSSWGADVLYNDPYVPRLSERMVSEELDDELLETADCVVIATDHSCYDWKWIVGKAKLVFDTRGVTKGLDKDKGNVYRLGERRD